MGRGAALSYDERVVTWTRPQGLETGKAERESAGRVEGSQMVQPPTAHTPPGGRGGLLNVKNESTFS